MGHRFIEGGHHSLVTPFNWKQPQKKKDEEQRGWSQRELADRAGMKQPQLARLETGQVEPKLDTLQRLAEALGCRVRVSFEPAHTTASAASNIGAIHG